MLSSDNNTQAVLFRIRKGADVNRSLNQLKDFSLRAYGRPYEPTRGQVGTILGKRNGVPDHQAQDLYILQDKAMNQRTRFPYDSNELKHILPTVYNGNVNMLASAGGAPLAYALNNPTELQQRIFVEGMRASEKNPLSAKFAAIARQRTFDNAVQGPATDIMRRELAGDADDPATTERKISSGHFGGSRNTHLTSDTQIDPEIEAFRNQHRAPTRSDLMNFQSQFTVPVRRITGSTVHNVNSINSSLNSIRAPGYHSRVPSGSSSISSISSSSSRRNSHVYAPYAMVTPSAPPASMAPLNVISSQASSSGRSSSSGWPSIFSKLRRQASSSGSLMSQSILNLSSSSMSSRNSFHPSASSGMSEDSLNPSVFRRSPRSGRTPLRRRKDPLSDSSQSQIGVSSTVRRGASTQQVRFAPPSIQLNRRAGASGRRLSLGSSSSSRSGNSSSTSHAWAM